MNQPLFSSSFGDRPTHPLVDILVVDDTPENVRLLSTMLSHEGYQVRKAMNGQMALTAMKALPPDLVLLDIMMPDMDGYQVCEAVKKDPQLAATPVIFLSALDDAFDKVKAFAVGGADYVTKPFHLEEVLMRVRHQLALRAATQQVHQINAELEQRVHERTQQLEFAHTQLRQIALVDGLTGLANRVAFTERLEESLQRAKVSPDDAFAVLLLDCDRFKIINDSLGHVVGDELLVAIASRLGSMIGRQDTLARFGGDEFAILLTHLLNQQSATQVAERILQAFEQPFSIREHSVFINVSIGIALCQIHPYGGDRNCKSEHLLRDADTAMYHAKSAGRAQYRVFEAAMHELALHQLQLETDLRQALAQQELLVYYQPIVCLKSGQIAGVEALIRWLHPQRGFVSPAEFIPVAEANSLIHSLGRWVLRQACHQVSEWKKQGWVSDEFSLSVNLSPYQVAQSNLVEQILHILQETQFPSRCLKLEITESALMDNPVLAAGIFTELRQHQVQISMDDFGTGYSSLSYLHAFPLDNLKIDRSFIQCLDHTPDSLGLVPIMVAIAQTLNINVIAEGVETDVQMAQLRSLGCHYGQGYYFAKPLPADALAALLRSQPHW
jgi:diguanylate cyclase (GGDEF)-like protein